MVGISHLIINRKKFSFMEILKTVFIHQYIGVILTLLASLLASIGLVGIDGGLTSKAIFDVRFQIYFN